MLQRSVGTLTLVFGIAIAAAIPVKAFAARTLETIYAFQGGSDGGLPHGGVLRDKAGNIYGTTGAGGAYGFGSVFKIAPNGTKTILYSFHAGTDGWAPLGRLIGDKDGNLYGTTILGGVADCFAYGCSGTVFKLAPDGTETVLHVFTGGTNDGADPRAGLIMDRAGNLYGTTETGGGTGCDQNVGCGTIYKIAPDGTETLLHVFGGDGDGAYGESGLLADKAGNLYGASNGGGINNAGTVFRLTPDGTETILHAFTGTDGANPEAGLIMDQAGNLYGTTQFGDNFNCPAGCGTVFRITPDGTETVLHSFGGDKDGAGPVASLMLDRQGNLYGTTYFGGGTGCFSQYGCGTIFRLAPDGTEKVLHRFTGGGDGSNPDSNFVLDDAGYLYATTTQGTTNGGTVFKIKK